MRTAYASPAVTAGRRVISRATLGAALPTADNGAAPIAEPAPSSPNAGAVTLYLGSSILGSALGGGVLGYAAASDLRGAYTGALLSVGAAGLADAYLLGKARITWGAVVGGLIGVAGVGSAIYFAATRRRRR